MPPPRPMPRPPVIQTIRKWQGYFKKTAPEYRIFTRIIQAAGRLPPDDLALRLLREAMEREADPESRAALISAYREADHGNFDP